MAPAPDAAETEDSEPATDVPALIPQHSSERGAELVTEDELRSLLQEDETSETIDGLPYYSAFPVPAVVNQHFMEQYIEVIKRQLKPLVWAAD